MQASDLDIYQIRAYNPLVNLSYKQKLVRFKMNKIDLSKEGEIYLMVCAVTEKCYVGQTRKHRLVNGKSVPFGTEGRFNEHVREAYDPKKRYGCTYLNNAILKHGEEMFMYDCIFECHLDELDEYERHFIKLHDTFNNGYNLNEGGFGGKLNPTVYERISNTNIEITDLQRRKEIKSLEIKSVHISDVMKGDGYLIIIELKTDKETIKYHNGGNLTGYNEMFKRVYDLVQDCVESNNIYVSHRVQHNLGLQAQNYEFNKDDVQEIASKQISQVKSFAGLDKRIARYSDYTIKSIILKRRNKHGNNIVAVCMKTAESTRDIVSEFGGDNLLFADAYYAATKLASSLTSTNKISVHPEVQNLITQISNTSKLREACNGTSTTAEV